MEVLKEHSGRTDVPVLEHLGRECYSDPLDVYERAKPRGADGRGPGGAQGPRTTLTARPAKALDASFTTSCRASAASRWRRVIVIASSCPARRPRKTQVVLMGMLESSLKNSRIQP
jgi:hypothetical protein